MTVSTITPGELAHRRRDASRLLVWAEHHQTTARPGEAEIWERRTAAYRRTLAELDRLALSLGEQLDLFEVMV